MSKVTMFEKVRMLEYIRKKTGDKINERLVSKETVVLHQWESETLNLLSNVRVNFPPWRGNEAAVWSVTLRWKTSEDLQGSLKICKDLQKIFEYEDLSKILKGSLKDLWRSSPGKSWCKILKEAVRILWRSC